MPRPAKRQGIIGETGLQDVGRLFGIGLRANVKQEAVIEVAKVVTAVVGSAMLHTTAAKRSTITREDMGKALMDVLGIDELQVESMRDRETLAVEAHSSAAQTAGELARKK